MCIDRKGYVRDLLDEGNGSMLNKLLMAAAYAMVVAHFFIVYLWVTNWERLETHSGLFAWGASIVFGLLLYLAVKAVFDHNRLEKMTRLAILYSTIMVSILAVMSLIIHYITASMP